MKILIYVPASPHPPYIYKETIDSIFNLSWTEPLQIVFDHQIAKGIHPDDLGNINLTQKWNRARDIVLKNGYDALLTIECDIIVPKLTLERLTRIKADVAYGLYVSRHTDHKWMVFEEFTETSNKKFYKSPGQCLEAWGQVMETVGVGTGCTLIHRNVLEKFPFRCVIGRKAPDSYLAIDCQANGFTQAHDLGVVCGHINKSDIYWPKPDGTYRMELSK